jgi:hypothetical protein
MSPRGTGAQPDILLTMRLAMLPLAVVTVLLASCGSEPKPATTQEPAKKAEAPRPRDETRRFPMANLVDTKVVNDHMLGKPFMPGGTLAHYKKGKIEYDMFVVKMPSALDAATALPDWNKALTNSKLVPSFGGYFGTDEGKRVFVFTKGDWVAGVVGLPEKDADLQARGLASRLD